MPHSDGDREAQAALDRQDVKKQVREKWGDNVFDRQGDIDRKALAARVFDTPADREFLEGIIHPIVWRTKAEARAEARDAGCTAALMDAPLLFEVGLDAECDRVIFVDAAHHIRVRRVAENRGWTEDQLVQREQTQLDPSVKQARSHYVIDNSGGLDELSRRVRVVYDQLMGGDAEVPLPE